MINSFRQSGGAHLVIIIILVVALLGTLGFVYWKNLASEGPIEAGKPDMQKTSSSAKTSEIIVLADSDMNKYVNYKEGFEFLFPKVVRGAVGCLMKNTVHDVHGRETPSLSYYTTSQGSAPMGIVETDGRYIAAPKDMYVLGEITPEGDYRLAKSCERQPVTLALIDFKNDMDSSKSVQNTIKREFDIVRVESDSEIAAYAQKVFSDNKATVTFGVLNDGRQELTFNHGPDFQVGGFAYRAWYYPAKKKLVYINLGQGAVLLSPSDETKHYDVQMADSFKFTAD